MRAERSEPILNNLVSRLRCDGETLERRGYQLTGVIEQKQATDESANL